MSSFKNSFSTITEKIKMGERYKGLIGGVHLWKEDIKEKWSGMKEEGGVAESFVKKSGEIKEKVITKINHGDEQYDHLYR